MGENTIDAVISLLPEKVIYDAACKHVIKLSQAGEVEKAENLYDKLYSIDASLESLAEAARCLVGAHIARYELDKALYIYDLFPDGAKNYSVLEEKLKTCHLLVFSLIPNHFKKAYSLWKEYSNYNLNSYLKWQWVQTGLALLESSYKNNILEMAVEIYSDIRKYGDCKINKVLLQKADRIMAKINR